ncbi:helix-turn-helix domain-containing protein [Sulfurimonas sp. HSL-1716]|uniref:winged helix-turn-helix domain-containing protein n=1 Tax=Hydrocurvibacter sulfurireducens TaxID=3131937 RepID=UPI0031F9DF7E
MINTDTESKLKLIKILYIVEEGVEHDYHILPFELICERVHISSFKDSWKHYLEVKPDIIMIHVVSDHGFCKKIITDIKKVNSECAFMILADEALRDFIPDSLCEKNDRILFQPIKFGDMAVALEEIVSAMNITYFMNDKLSYEPHNSVLMHDNKRIELTTKENKLLTYLIQNSHRIVSYDEIESYVWNNMYMNRNTLTSIISNIRKKAGNANLIKNYSNQGYKVVTQDVVIK